MENLYSYVKKYGDRTFKAKEFNDIDNLVFSLLSYLDYSHTSINLGNYTLNYIGKEYFKLYDYYDIRKLGRSQKDAFKLLEIIIDMPRYKDIVLSDYIYNTNKNMQFSAITFNISKNLKYICFEGTDELICGWKEDGKLACEFPVPAHVEAINYINNQVKLFGANVIVGGHSKGGNLALVSSMFIKSYKRFKIKKIYSNDGPGLRQEEFNSKQFKKIKNRYIHIVPDSSIIGMLLRHNSHTVVKSHIKNINCHYLTSWHIKDDKLVLGQLSDKSKRLEKSIIQWIENHSDDDKTKMVDNLFKVLEDSNIESVPSMTSLKNIFKIIKGIKNIDKQTRDLTIDLITNGYLSSK